MNFQKNILKNDTAQALTEFVLVIPVVLFVFFVLIQFIIVVNITQLSNYATYCAARSLAVQKNSPAKHAKNAAAIAFMPASKPVPGELEFYMNRLDLVSVEQIENYLKANIGFDADWLDFFRDNYTSDDAPPPVGTVPASWIWLFTSWNRLKYLPDSPANLSYAVRNIAEDVGLQEVHVQTEYNLPLYLPGFSELWNFLRGPEIAEKYSTPSPLMTFPCITIPGKCSMGYENWSGDVRLEDGTDSEAAGGGSPNADPTSEIQDLNQQRIEAEEHLEELEEELEECLDDADDAEEEQDCHDFYDPQIQATENLIDSLGQQTADAVEDIQDQADDAIGDFGDAISGACQ